MVLGGNVVCPDAGQPCTIEGQQGVCAIGRTSCVENRTVCAPTFTASPERCDNLDNDCDGRVDEESGTMRICDDPRLTCDRGQCVETCLEGGCPEGFYCSPRGVCLETACRDVNCEEGQRCEGGRCIPACEGIRCPEGQTCLAGRCVDLCETVRCDPACEVCENGECVPRCFRDAECGRDRRCVEGRCLFERCGTGCPSGEICTPGGCVDACTVGTVSCPRGEVCMRGRCVPRPPPPDAGPPPMPDAYVPPGTDTGVDAFSNIDYTMDAGPPDAWSRRNEMMTGTRRSACDCSVPGAASSAPHPLAILMLLSLVAILRRRSF